MLYLPAAVEDVTVAELSTVIDVTVVCPASEAASEENVPIELVAT